MFWQNLKKTIVSLNYFAENCDDTQEVHPGILCLPFLGTGESQNTWKWVIFLPGSEYFNSYSSFFLLSLYILDHGKSDYITDKN